MRYLSLTFVCSTLLFGCGEKGPEATRSEPSKDLAAARASAAGAETRPRIKSAAFSAIIIVGAFVLPLTSRGMMEASITRKPSNPLTRKVSSTTAIPSWPILQVPTG